MRSVLLEKTRGTNSPLGISVACYAICQVDAPPVIHKGTLRTQRRQRSVLTIRNKSAAQQRRKSHVAALHRHIMTHDIRHMGNSPCLSFEIGILYTIVYLVIEEESHANQMNAGLTSMCKLYKPCFEDTL